MGPLTAWLKPYPFKPSNRFDWRERLLGFTLHSTTESAGNRTHAGRGYLFIAAATFCWGLSATMGRAVFTGKLFGGAQELRPIEPLILAQSRTTIALLILLPILLLKARSSLRVRSRHLVQFFLLGILGLAASN